MMTSTGDTSWFPRVSGNPAGRPKKTSEQVEFEFRCRKMMSAKGWKFLEEMMDSPAKVDKKWVIEIFLDRGFGKAIQPAIQETYNYGADNAGLTDDQIYSKLREIAQKIDDRQIGGAIGINPVPSVEVDRTFGVPKTV